MVACNWLQCNVQLEAHNFLILPHIICIQIMMKACDGDLVMGFLVVNKFYSTSYNVIVVWMTGRGKG